jgi:hypothetical protein
LAGFLVALERTNVPVELDPLDGIDPTHYLNIAGEETEKQTALDKLIKSLRGRRIFFYPACGSDWNPLHRFTHLCDTFVYCDFRARVEIFNKYLALIGNGVRRDIRLKETDLHQDMLNDLAKSDAEQAEEFPNVDGAWGKVIHLIRHIANVERKIRLFYFRAEGVTLYRNLFNKGLITPRMICFKQLDVCQQTFLRWDGPLGRAVWENRGRPEFIVSAYAPPDYDWPWSEVWQHHKWDSDYDWDLGRDMTQLESYSRPGELRVSAGTTENRADKRTIIRLKRPPFKDANIPNGAPMVSLRREREVQTLEMALSKLGDRCALDGTRDVHSIGCHFEDEAPALYEWKRKSSQPKTLTIHCETQGDLACYGPAADEVLD